MKRGLLLLTILLLGLGYAVGQERTVTGMITSAEEDGAPLVQATVRIKGTTTGVVTDAGGRYSITVPGPEAVLEFSYAGMASQEILVGAQSVINVVLEPDLIDIDDVVVVAYGTQRKGSLTGAVSSVSNEKLSPVARESLTGALGGKVSGVRISQTSGNPGAGQEIMVRGVGSISAGTDPLFVIDGVPVNVGNYGSSSFSQDVMSSLNPDDVESVSVLKDAAASSLYGSRAANGVVLITTKRGKEGDATINARANVGWNMIAVPDAFRPMTGDQWRAYYEEMLSGFIYVADYGLSVQPTAENLKLARDQAQEELKDHWNSYYKTQDANTEWYEHIFKTAMVQDYAVSSSGGNSKTRYFLSGGYLRNSGTVINSMFQRFSGTLNLDTEAKPWLRMGGSAKISYARQDGFTDNTEQSGSASYGSPLGLLMQLDPTANFEIEQSGTTLINPNVGLGNHTIRAPEEVFSEKSYITWNKNNRNLLGAYVEILPMEGLSLKSNVGIDNMHNNFFNHWTPTSIDGAVWHGLGEYYSVVDNTLTSSTILSYQHTFAEQHNISAMMGFEYMHEWVKSSLTSNSNYSTDGLIELKNATEPLDANTNASERAMISYLGRAEYNFANRYYVSASLRRDASSQLGPKTRAALFYSVSGSWRVNHESFMEATSSWLSDLKLRASYGTNGTLPVGWDSHMGYMRVDLRYGGNSAAALSQIENPNLTWEKSSNLNIGLDFGLFKRFNFTMEWWRKYTTDLILHVKIPYATGLSNMPMNTGEILNTGIDFDFHSMNLDIAGFRWGTDLTLSWLKTKVVKLPEGKDIIVGATGPGTWVYREGEEMFTFFLPVWHGVNPDNGLGEFVVDPTKPAEGDNLTINYHDAMQGVNGGAIPNVTFGLNNTLSWKGITLSFLITGSFGGQMWDHWAYFTNNDGRRGGGVVIDRSVHDNYWKKPGDKAKHPRPIWYYGPESDRWSTRQLHCTDHIRLKEIGLSYTLPKQWTQALKINDVTFSIRSTNTALLWIKDKDIKFDPEVPLNGYRSMDTPPLRTVVMGLSLKF